MDAGPLEYRTAERDGKNKYSAHAGASSLSHPPSPKQGVPCQSCRLYSQRNSPKGLHSCRASPSNPPSQARLLQQPPCHHAPSPGSQACRSMWSAHLERSPPRHDPVRLANHSSSLPQTLCSRNVELVIVLQRGLLVSCL